MMTNNSKPSEYKVLMCAGDPGIQGLLIRLISASIPTNSDLTTVEAGTSIELLNEAGKSFNLAVVVLNNVIFPDRSISVESRVECMLKLVSAIKGHRVPVIALAGWPDDPSFEDRVIKAGADHFFRMPCDSKAFMDAVGKLLQ